MGKINDFNWKEESYDLVALLEVREDQSLDFYKPLLVSIGPVVGEIWDKDSLKHWEWRFWGGMAFVNHKGVTPLTWDVNRSQKRSMHRFLSTLLATNLPRGR